MKKLILLSACVCLGIGAFAQQAVLKEAERIMKSKAPMTKVIEVVKPAFTNPETQNDAQTWYIPGKAAFNEYDNLLGMKAFGKLPENGTATMGKNLIEGYKYFTKSLSLDSVADAKGKIKTRYSKDIISTLAGHYNDYNNHAIELWNIKDYPGAYESWGIYLEMSAQPEKFKGIKVPGDTLLSEIMYNQALAAWQAEDLKASLQSFINAKNAGYTKKNVYDYAISVASQIQDTATIMTLAREALPLYGSEDPMYIRFIINDYLTKKEYDKALESINEAILSDPNNADYYIVLGVIYENQDKRDEARESYKKALNIDPNVSMANFYYGKALCDQAYIISDQASSNADEIQETFDKQLKPLFLEAAQYLEKAYELDNDNRDALRYLENVYYNLKDEKMLDDVQKRMQY